MHLREHAFDAAQTTALGNRFLVGNGYLGVRGTLDEYGREQLVAVNLAGIYDRHGDGWREPLNAPNPWQVVPYFEGRAWRLPEDTPAEHEQGLDYGHGLQQRRTVWQTPKGAFTVASERLAHMADVHLLAMAYTVQATAGGTAELHFTLDGDVWDIHGPHYTTLAFTAAERGVDVLAAATEGAQVAVCLRLLEDVPVTVSRNTQTGTIIVPCPLPPGEERTFHTIAAIYTSQDGADPLTLARQAAAKVTDYAALRATHCAAWETLWEAARFTIDGDPAAEEALNYSNYHLLCLAPRHGKPLSIAARGLSGQTYKGAAFWDTEMFMLDFYLRTLPEVAQALVRYRIETLPGALEKAAQYGFRGAFYAWESQEGGFDGCSDYNVTDVFTGRPLRTFFRDKQIHISAAVVYGYMRVLRETGAAALLKDGAEMVLQCARFYRSRMVRALDSDVYELRDVIGPDEYHERVDNNAYTNELARFTLRAALEVAALLKASDPAAYAALDAKIRFEAELPGFAEAARQLKRQGGNGGLIEQFDGYFALEDADIATVRSRLLHEKEYWGGAYGVASHTQVIKQADVVTLLYMLAADYPDAVVHANFAYYAPRTEHGSSLSACMHALVACRLGLLDTACDFFMKSARADLVGGGKEWAGLVYIGGTHPAAAGGAYMTAVNGFLGLRVDGDHITLHPRLPQGWQRVRCTLRIGGRVFSVDVRAGDGEIVLV